MSSQLEQYLRDIAVELHGLPRERREEEIEEIRNHLQAYAAKEKDAGATDDVAVRAAIAQFGDPAEVGRKISRAGTRFAWRQSPWFAATLAAFLSLLWANAQQVVRLHNLRATGVLGMAPHAAWDSAVFAILLGLFLGVCCAMASPKGAVRGVAWYMLISSIYPLSVITISISNPVFVPHGATLSATHMGVTMGWPAMMATMWLTALLRIGSAVGSAYLISRLAAEIEDRKLHPA